MKYFEAGSGRLSVLFKNNSVSAFFLLAAEIWLGYVFWSVNAYFLYQVYFYSLSQTASNGASFVYFIVYLVPFCLCIPKVSSFVGSNLSWFRVPALLSLLLSFLPHDVRAVFACIGVAGLLLAFCAACSHHHIGDDGWCGRDIHEHITGRCRHVRFFWGLVAGLLLWWILRTGFLTVDPQFNYSLSYSTVFFFVGLLACVVVFTSEMADRKNAPLKEAMEIGRKHVPWKKLTILRRVLRELAWIPTSAFLGSTLFIIAWMYSSCEALPRWVGVDHGQTLGWGWGLIAAYVAGMILTPVLIKGIIWYLVLIIGCGLSGSVLHGGGYLGGLFMAFSLPFMLFYIFMEISNIARYGIALGVGFILLFLYEVTALGVVFGSVSPMGLPFHAKPGNFLWLVVMLMAILLIVMHVLNSLSESRRKFLSPQEVAKELIGFKLKRPPTEVLITTGLILLLGLLFVIGRAVMYSQDLIHTLPQHDEPLRVMTFNIYQGTNTNGTQNVGQVVQVLKEYGADLVGFQESDAVHISTRNLDPVTYIAGHMQMDSFFGLPNVDSTVGTSIISRTPLSSREATAMAHTADKSLTRPCTQADIYFNGTQITVIVVHIELAQWAPMDVQLQISFIVNKIQSINNPVILLGDFNNKPDSPYIQQLRDIGLTSAYEMQYNLTQPPYNLTQYGHTNPDGEEYIDYVFYRNLTLVDAGIFISEDPNLYGTSDHLPVFATFRT